MEIMALYVNLLAYLYIGRIYTVFQVVSYVDIWNDWSIIICKDIALQVDDCLSTEECILSGPGHEFGLIYSSFFKIVLASNLVSISFSIVC